MGTVWRGVHRAQQLPVAVKFVLSKEVATDNLMERFADEVRAVAGLEHSGIVTVFDYGRVPKALEESTNGLLVADSPWLAMELISGGTLRTAAPKSWEELRRCLNSILEALGSAHARGILHRDLKPDNVLFASTKDLREGLRLVDFGLAFLDEGQGEANEHKAAGTPRYMAPEQLLSHWRDFGPWTDLYALGCLGWQLATGATPFQNMRDFRQLLRAHLHLAPPAFRPLYKVPEGLEGWLRTLLAKRRSDRFPFAADALNALQALEQGETLEEKMEVEPSAAIDDLDLTIAEVPSAATVALGADPTLADDQTAPSLEIKTVDIPALEVPEPLITSLDETIPEMPDDWARDGEDQARLQMLGVGLGLFGLRHTSLVGRKSERSALWQALKQVRKSGKPKLVLLSGGPGSGKSRLADWMSHRSHETGAAITLRCNHDPQGNSKGGLQGMVNRYLHTSGLSREELEDRVAKQLDRQGVADAFELRALCDFLDAESEGSLTDLSMSIKFQTPEERMALMLRFLKRCAARRPVVLWMDDVQWGDEALFLARSLQSLADDERLPVLVLMTLRDDLIEDRPLEHQLLSELNHDAMLKLPIRPLPDVDQVALVEDMLGLEPKLARRVVARSQGNPLFAVQLVGDWVQRGVLQISTSGFILKPGTRAVIPQSIAQVWNERIDALLRELPAGSEQVLELGATLGLEVDRGEWEQVCALEGFELQSSLVEGLLKRRMAEHNGTLSGLRHAHGMLREALMNRASAAGRLKQHHKVCAQMLADKKSQLGISERQARHLIAAGLHFDALVPLLTAASERRASSDLRQAIRLLDIHEKAANLEQLPLDDDYRLRAQILRSEILSIMGNTVESGEIAQTTLDLARKLDQRYLIGASLRVLGVSTMRSGHTQEAWEMFEEALSHLESIQADDLVVQTHLNLLNLSRHLGWWDQAKTHAEDSLRSAEELKSDLLIGNAHFYTGVLSYQRGELALALQHYQSAAQAYEAANNNLGLANCTNAMGNLARQEGRFEEASQAFRQAVEIHQNIGSGHDLPPMMSLALAHLETGNMGAARSLLEAGCGRCRRDEKKHMLGCALACLLPCYASAEDWTNWDTAIEESSTLLDETGVLSTDVAWPVQKAAELALAAGENQRAVAAYQIALRQWMGLGRDQEVGQVMGAIERLVEH
jgi:serine/threonine protein kinase/tetratricopeptide (TPR) repeat protein